VVVIDWTETGASPPTLTPPTSKLDGCDGRGANGFAGAGGIPRPTGIACGSSHEENYLKWIGLTMSADARTTVKVAKIATTAYGRGQQLGQIHALERASIAPDTADAVAQLLEAEHREVTAVEREQGQQVGRPRRTG